jgi:hypothetical protein
MRFRPLRSVDPADRAMLLTLAPIAGRQRRRGNAFDVRRGRGVKYDKAVEWLIDDRDALLAFYDFPVEHCKHLRTTDLVERSFAGARRTVRSKGCLSNTPALARSSSSPRLPKNVGVASMAATCAGAVVVAKTIEERTSPVTTGLGHMIMLLFDTVHTIAANASRPRRTWNR